MSITPFKINIPQSELDLLYHKLQHARLPSSTSNAQWGETNGVTTTLMTSTLDHWRSTFSWREQEAHLNTLPQFTTPIQVEGFGTLTVHFIHANTTSTQPTIPLLFLHGWPGSFIEVTKILPQLLQAGFDVVAPSLPGFGFSEYTDRKGFKLDQHAECMHNLMRRLGYEEYAVQGGDWGSWVGRVMAIRYGGSIRGLHLNMFCMPDPTFEVAKRPEYTPFEQSLLARRQWFRESQSAYSALQSSKPRTLGFALHDSPVAMLAWMADKLFTWTDDYPWTPTELITWTLLHWFPGPSTALEIYNENGAQELLETGTVATGRISVPTGVSAFAKELEVVPRRWVEERAKVVWWKEHEKGGHFAAWEKPDVFTADVVEFGRMVWAGKE